jgi:CRISPR-associated endonuclease Cas2
MKIYKKLVRKMWLLIFDIPNSKEKLQRKINRMLHKLQANCVQKSVWKSENLEILKAVVF